MIIRNAGKRQFTTFETAIARNGTFRPDELGLYITMLAHTDNWDFSAKALSRETDATPEEIGGILKRLEEKGFVKRRRSRYGVIWDLFETPHVFVGRAAEPPEGNANAVPCEARKTPEKQDEPPAADGNRTEMTQEEIGQTLIDYAKKLKRDALARKAGLPG